MSGTLTLFAIIAGIFVIVHAGLAVVFFRMALYEDTDNHDRQASLTAARWSLYIALLGALVLAALLLY
jgi:uncharacterized membrane protein YozB (DUF420 family)